MWNLLTLHLTVYSEFNYFLEKIIQDLSRNFVLMSMVLTYIQPFPATNCLSSPYWDENGIVQTAETVWSQAALNAGI